MEEQILKNIWKRSSQNEDILINKETLMKDFKDKMERREQIVRNRDLRENIGALIGIVSFLYTFYEYSNIITRAGCIIGVISLLYLMYKLHNNRKSKFTQELFLPIQDQLKHQRQFMVNQEKLLDTALYWMFIPIFIATILSFWGFSKSEQPLTVIEQFTAKWEAKLLITLVIALIFGYLGWMNKKAARVNWRPLVKQIDTVLENLEKKE